MLIIRMLSIQIPAVYNVTRPPPVVVVTFIKGFALSLLFSAHLSAQKTDMKWFVVMILLFKATVNAGMYLSNIAFILSIIFVITVIIHIIKRLL